MYACMHVCMYASIYVRMYAYMYVRMYVYSTYVGMYVRFCVCIHARVMQHTMCVLDKMVYIQFHDESMDA